jgi:hypothetical protein
VTASEETPTLVEVLVAMAQQTPEVVDVLARSTDAMSAFIKELDSALARVQDDPQDLGSRMARSLVLRGSAESILNAAYERVTKESL